MVWQFYNNLITEMSEAASLLQKLKKTVPFGTLIVTTASLGVMYFQYRRTVMQHFVEGQMDGLRREIKTEFEGFRRDLEIIRDKIKIDRQEELDSIRENRKSDLDGIRREIDFLSILIQEKRKEKS